ncbi:hypothetical protein JL722_11854 [Aureococcus anophagefferens]|nr:hypothetical protein JL722_11854 [Aureococcus anophagefferens]
MAESAAELRGRCEYDADAAYNLSFMLAQGRGGLKRDRGEALRLLVRSAELGKVQAQVQYAALLADGRGGVARDEASAARWLETAADGGYAEAQFRLGCMVAAGKGGPADAARARRLVAAAAAQGHVDAKARARARTPPFRSFDESYGIARPPRRNDAGHRRHRIAGALGRGAGRPGRRRAGGLGLRRVVDRAAPAPPAPSVFATLGGTAGALSTLFRGDAARERRRRPPRRRRRARRTRGSRRRRGRELEAARRRGVRARARTPTRRGTSPRGRGRGAPGRVADLEAPARGGPPSRQGSGSSLASGAELDRPETLGLDAEEALARLREELAARRGPRPGRRGPRRGPRTSRRETRGGAADLAAQREALDAMSGDHFATHMAHELALQGQADDHALALSTLEKRHVEDKAAELAGLGRTHQQAMQSLLDQHGALRKDHEALRRARDAAEKQLAATVEAYDDLVKADDAREREIGEMTSLTFARKQAAELEALKASHASEVALLRADHDAELLGKSRARGGRGGARRGDGAAHGRGRPRRRAAVVAGRAPRGARGDGRGPRGRARRARRVRAARRRGLAGGARGLRRRARRGPRRRGRRGRGVGVGAARRGDRAARDAAVAARTHAEPAPGDARTRTPGAASAAAAARRDERAQVAEDRWARELRAARDGHRAELDRAATDAAAAAAEARAATTARLEAAAEAARAAHADERNALARDRAVERLLAGEMEATLAAAADAKAAMEALLTGALADAAVAAAADAEARDRLLKQAEEKHRAALRQLKQDVMQLERDHAAALRQAAATHDELRGAARAAAATPSSSRPSRTRTTTARRRPRRGRARGGARRAPRRRGRGASDRDDARAAAGARGGGGGPQSGDGGARAGLELLRKAGKSATALEERRRVVAARAADLEREAAGLREALEAAKEDGAREARRAEAFRHELWKANREAAARPGGGDGGAGDDDGYLNVLGCFGGGQWSTNPCGAGDDAVEPDARRRAASEPVEFGDVPTTVVTQQGR